MFIYESAKPASKVKVTKPAPPPAKSRDVLDHIKKGWLPVDSTTLEHVKDAVSSGVSRGEVLSLVKQDLGLFFHCAEQVRQHTTTQDPAGLDPVKELLLLEDEKLLNLLKVESTKQSKRPLYEESAIMASCDKVAQISAVAAERLSVSMNIPTTLASGGAIFRRLGHQLIAWNYPKLYARTLVQHRQNRADLDAQLFKLLGLSPAKISAKFGSEWGINTEIIRSIGSTTITASKDPTKQELRAETVSLAELVEISELFAKSKDPIAFPVAAELWESHLQLIQTLWGNSILLELESDADTLVRRYTSSSSATTGIIEIDPEDSKAVALSLNKYLEGCPEEVQIAMGKVYERVHGGTLTIDAMRSLVDGVVPMLGYPRGCLFLRDDKTYDLRPALRIGSVPLVNYEQILLDSRKGIVTSLNTLAPIRMECTGVAGHHTNIVFGNLRSKQYQGVLYLELGQEIDPEASGYNVLTTFHCLREAVNHCLGT